MSIYCPLSEALGIDPAGRSVLDIPEPDWDCESDRHALSVFSSQIQKELVKDGTHHFLDKSFQSKNGKKGYEKAIESGNHHCLQPSFLEIASNRIAKGTHNFQNSELQRNNVMKGIQNGTHSSCKTFTCLSLIHI